MWSSRVQTLTIIEHESIDLRLKQRRMHFAHTRTGPRLHGIVNKVPQKDVTKNRRSRLRNVRDLDNTGAIKIGARLAFSHGEMKSRVQADVLA